MDEKEPTLKQKAFKAYRNTMRDLERWQELSERRGELEDAETDYEAHEEDLEDIEDQLKDEELDEEDRADLTTRRDEIKAEMEELKEQKEELEELEQLERDREDGPGGGVSKVIRIDITLAGGGPGEGIYLDYNTEGDLTGGSYYYVEYQGTEEVSLSSDEVDLVAEYYQIDPDLISE